MIVGVLAKVVFIVYSQTKHRHYYFLCNVSQVILFLCIQVEFPPDLCSRVTFVNFTVTLGSLQSQCLNQVLKAERPDVDAKRSDLLKLQGEFLLRLRHLEQSLLQALNEVKGRILDDDRWVRRQNSDDQDEVSVVKITSP